MTDEQLAKRNATKIAECHPALRKKFEAVIKDLQSHGWRPRIQETWRSEADQLIAYKKGASSVKYGYHNCSGAHGPEALAMDVILDDKPYEEPRKFLLQLASSALTHELNSGIFFGSKKNPLTIVDKTAIRQAIATKNWEFDGKIGWDPWHVEVVGITLAEARAGIRPS